MYLRFKKENIFDLRPKYGGRLPICPEKAKEQARAGTFLSVVRDFLYFNDFYLISAALITFLIYIILKSIG